MTKTTYYVNGGADPEVGLGMTEAKIVIEDNYIDEDDSVQVENWKEFLAEYYDLDKKYVFTEEEWNNELNSEEVKNEKDKL